MIDLPTPVIPVKKTGFPFIIDYFNSHENLTVSFVGTTNSKKLFSDEYSNFGKSYVQVAYSRSSGP